MISNEGPLLRRNHRRDYSNPNPPVPEETISRETVQIERKVFAFTLKENAQGRFLRITEEAGGRRNTIIIPSTGLEEFKRLLDEMTKSAGPMSGRDVSS